MTATDSHKVCPSCGGVFMVLRDDGFCFECPMQQDADVRMAMASLDEVERAADE